MEQKLSKSYSEAYDKFADWVAAKEKLLKSTCHCGLATSKGTASLSNGLTTKQLSSTPLSSNGPASNGITHTESILDYHIKLQDEVEATGKQLYNELRWHLEQNSAESSNECTKQHLEQSEHLAERWHKLWLTSMEQLVIVERFRPCPSHYSTSNGTPPKLKLHQSNSSGSPNLQATARKSSSLKGSPRKRPTSYPNNNYTDRLEWDYKNTLMLTGCHKENGSHIDLDSVDEQITKNLTEFGENYELWLGKEDEIATLDSSHTTPSSSLKKSTELTKAVIISTNSTNSSNNDVNCNLLMLTTPSSIFSVDASNCSQQEKPTSYGLRLFGAFLFAIAALLFSSLYTEPHHIHKSYYHSQPPV